MSGGGALSAAGARTRPLGRREGVVSALVAELQPRQLGEQSKAQVMRMVPIEDGGEHGDPDELAMRLRAPARWRWQSFERSSLQGTALGGRDAKGHLSASRKCRRR